MSKTMQLNEEGDGNSGLYCNYLSPRKEMAISDSGGELQQRAGEAGDDRAAAWAGTLTMDVEITTAM